MTAANFWSARAIEQEVIEIHSRASPQPLSHAAWNTPVQFAASILLHACYYDHDPEYATGDEVTAKHLFPVPTPRASDSLQLR